MADKYVLHTEEQDAIIRRVCDIVLKSPQFSVQGETYTEKDRTPDIYIARAHSDDPEILVSIPPLTPGDIDIPGQATCDIFRIVETSSGPIIEPVATDETVYNIELYPVRKRWVQVHRDKWGKWIAIATPDAYLFKLVKCGTGTGEEEAIYVSNNLTQYVGKVVKVEGTCYTVETVSSQELEAVQQSCTNPVCVVIEQAYDDCFNCCGCWAVRNCYDSEETKTIRADVLDFLGLDNADDAIGKVICFNGQCWIIESYYECGEACESAEDVTLTSYYNNCEETPGYELIECTGTGEYIYTKRAIGPTGNAIDLHDYLNKVLRLSNCKCYFVSEAPGTGSLPWEEIAVLESYENCMDCKIYQLQNCSGTGETQSIITYTDLQAQIGDIVQDTEGNCYEVIDDDVECDPENPPVAFDFDSKYSTCEECYNNTKYLLVNNCKPDDCQGGEDAEQIVTTEPLGNAVGKYVRVGGICYSVGRGTTLPVTHTELDYEGPFEDCDQCKETPVTTKVSTIYSISLDTANNRLVGKVKELVFKDGLFIGACQGGDVFIDTTECET